MKTKYLWILFGVTVIGTGLGYVLTNPSDFGICERSVFCYYLDLRGSAIFYGMLALAIVFVLLLLVPKSFNAWKKFAIWFIPIATLLFIGYEDSSFSWYSEDVYRFVAKVYVVVSAVIIGWKYWTLNKGKKW